MKGEFEELRIEENELNLERERERNPRNWGRGGFDLSGHGNEMKLKNENGLSADDVTTPSSFIFVSFLLFNTLSFIFLYIYFWSSFFIIIILCFLLFYLF